MKAKMRGGPMNGKYWEDTNYSDRIEVRAPVQPNLAEYWMQPMEVIKVKRGHYARSNIRLKNGTPIFIWMGWVEE